MTRLFSHAPISFRNMSPGVKNLIIANVTLFIVGAVVGPAFFQHFGLVPRLVLEDRWVWQPVSYMFVHGGFVHLLFNVFMLWMFGMAVEAQWGTREFLKFYFVCGMGVALAKILLWPHSMVALVGASGAIFGLMVAFAMLYPEAVVYLWFFIPVKAAHMAVLCGLMEFFMMLGQGDPSVDHFAHLAGIAVGYAYIRWWWELKLRVKTALTRLAPPAPPAKPRRPARPRTLVQPQEPAGPAGMEEVDRILDKILASGLGSLTEAEREVMKRYSDRMKH